MDKHIQTMLVDFIPEALDQSVIYVSHMYGTAVHLCACGCKAETVTPMSLWQLTVNKNRVTLKPSIQNTACATKSHYWITNGCIEECS